MRKHSIPTRQVLLEMMDAPAEETYGFELVKKTGLPSGTVYPILRRFEDQGWVAARAEVIDPHARRPRHRIYYQLTPEGRSTARQAIGDHKAMLRSLSPGWAP